MGESSGRDVHVVETLELWRWGGGVHCVTNDQPLESSASGVENLARAGPQRLLDQNQPNPFNPRTQIRFQMVNAGSAQLAVYNMSGRLVRNLFDGLLEIGDHEVIWDGTNNAGHSVPSGVYFYKLRADMVHETRRMTLVR